jgi:hypothetical protein
VLDKRVKPKLDLPDKDKDCVIVSGHIGAFGNSFLGNNGIIVTIKEHCSLNNTKLRSIIFKSVTKPLVGSIKK